MLSYEVCLGETYCFFHNTSPKLGRYKVMPKICDLWEGQQAFEPLDKQRLQSYSSCVVCSISYNRSFPEKTLKIHITFQVFIYRNKNGSKHDFELQFANIVHVTQQVLISISTYKICQSRDHNHMKIWVKVSQNFKFQKILGS